MRVVIVGKPGVGRNMVLCCACVFVCVAAAAFMPLAVLL